MIFGFAWNNEVPLKNVSMLNKLLHGVRFSFEAQRSDQDVAR